MQLRTKQRLIKWTTGIVLAYLAGGLLLYFGQELLLFHGKPVPAAEPYRFQQAFMEINIERDGGVLNLVHFPVSGTKKGTVLFFHGNMRNVAYYSQYPPFFLRNGYEVWMIDYPGFGKTTGRRTEAGLYADARRLFDEAVKQNNSDSLVIYGKSIGTGIATQLAATTQCKKLILETPYYNADALAQHYLPIYPTQLLIQYRLPTNEYLPQVKAPVQLFHGDGDEIIPYRQAAQLKKENPSVELMTLAGGKHNNLWQFALFQKKLDSLLR